MWWVKLWCDVKNILGQIYMVITLCELNISNTVLLITSAGDVVCFTTRMSEISVTSATQVMWQNFVRNLQNFGSDIYGDKPPWIKYIEHSTFHYQCRRSSLFCNSSVRHERHKWDTSSTRVTQVRHECDTNNTILTRVKKIAFDNDTGRNILSRQYISYMGNERLQGELRTI